MAFIALSIILGVMLLFWRNVGKADEYCGENSTYYAEDDECICDDGYEPAEEGYGCFVSGDICGEHSKYNNEDDECYCEIGYEYDKDEDECIYFNNDSEHNSQEVFFLHPKDGTCLKGDCPEGMCYIPAPGIWKAGCHIGHSYYYRGLVCAVDLRYSFCIDQTEVTEKDFTEVAGFNPSKSSDCDKNCPVVNVTWNNANLYCKKQGKRLPTEGEWEYVASAGEPVVREFCPELRKYAKRDEFEKLVVSGNITCIGLLSYFAWMDEIIHPVSTKHPNQFGVFDMIGNAREWVDECYADGKATKKYLFIEDGGNSEHCVYHLTKGKSVITNYDGYDETDLVVKYRGVGRDDLSGIRCIKDIASE